MDERFTVNDPTTGEIVRALRCDGDIDNKDCSSCHYDEYGCCGMKSAAADRLESQERDIETLRAFHERYAEQTSKKYVEEICALTARAEQAEKNCDIWEKKWWEEALKKVEAQAFKEKAERERDAAVDAIADIKENGFCGSCKGCNAPYVGQEKITFCYGWEWRGLQPQEGVKT